MTPITPKRERSDCCAPPRVQAAPTVKVDTSTEAQCCAKRSRTVAGCHD